MKTIFGIKGFALSEYAISANAILGIRDSGKTYTATEASEELFDAGVPFVWFDPIGVAHNLRVPGKGPGYPVVVAGGKSGDLPLRPENAKAIVRAAMESGVSLVIDLFSVEMNKTMWRKIVKECGEVLLYENDQYGLRHVFIEEAAEFVPQVVRDGDVFNVVEKMVRMGGNAKLGCTLINQRSEDMNKSVLELCANIFLHRQKGKNTLTGLRKWMNLIAEDEAEKIAASLPNLKSGQCWAFLHDIEHPVFLTIPEKNSLHPDRRATISTVQAAKHKPVAADEFVAALKGRLGAIEEETKANDPRALKAEIGKLKGEIAKLSASDQVEKINTAALDAANAEGYRAGWLEGHKIGIGTARAAHKFLAESLRSEVDRAIGEASGLIDAQAFAQEQERPKLRQCAKNQLSVAPSSIPPSSSGRTPDFGSGKRGSNPRGGTSAGNGHDDLTGPQRRIMASLAFWYSVGQDSPTRAQVAGVAGYKPGSGNFNNIIGGLNSLGKVSIPQTGRLSLATRWAAVPDRDEAAAQLGSVLNGPQRRLVDVLLDAGDAITREDLAKGADYSAGSGNFNNIVGSLCALDVVRKPRAGAVELSDWAREVLS